MFRNVFAFGGMLLLTGALLFGSPHLAHAQHGGHGGGGHGGGAHFSGGHSGGAHFSGSHFAGAHFSGGHFGGFRGGFYPGIAVYGGSRYGYPYYPYYGSYGFAYPYSYGNNYPYTYGAYPYGWSGPAYDYSGYGGPDVDVAPDYTGSATSAAPSAGGYQSFYPPATATAPSDATAHVTVNVPADARLWFNSTATTSAGAVRQFESPPLTPGMRYNYEVRASWTENGREITQTQQAAVTAGAQVRVDFPVRAATAGQASSTKER